MQMPRQLRNKGGITSVVPRTNYLFGGIKDRIRKLIPNELASVASKAAPLVAPFFPGTASLMRGIGRFDKRGSLSDAVKQGIGTYAFGRGVGMLGGAQAPETFLGRQQFTEAGFDQGPIGRLFDKQAADPTFTRPNMRDIAGDKPSLISTARDVIRAGIKKLPDGVVAQLTAGGITAGASLLASYFQGEFEEQQPGETTAEYMERRREYVGQQMRVYMDNYYANDPEYMKLDEAGKNALVDRYNIRDGGRVGYQTGGISSANTLAENIRRNRAAQDAFQKSINPSRQRIVEKLKRSFPVAETLMNVAAPAINLGRGILGLQDPIGTPSMGDRMKELEATKGPTGSIGYEDYGLPVATSGGRFTGGLPKLALSNPVDFALAGSAGRYGFSPEGRTDLKYDFTPDQDTGSTGNAILDFVNQGGVKAKVSDLLTPSTAEAAETTQTPDAGIGRPTMADVAGPSRETIIQRILKDIEPTFQMDNTEANRNFLDQFKTGLDLDYLKTLNPDEIKLALDNKYLQGQNFQNPDFSRGRIGRGDPFFRYGPQYMEQFNMQGNPLQLSSQLRGYNLRNELGELESILGKEGIKPYRTTVDDALIDFYKTQMSGDTDLQQRIFGLASGGMPTGIMTTNKAGVKERDYRETGGFVPVGIKEKADDVPAMLSKNEFVFTADAVRGAGNGSIERGAQKMYDTMKRLEKRVV